MKLTDLLPDFVKVNFVDLTSEEIKIKKEIEECNKAFQNNNRVGFNNHFEELIEMLGNYKGEYQRYFREKYEDLIEKGRY